MGSIRKYIRHPASIPIEVHTQVDCGGDGDGDITGSRNLTDVSYGGVSFASVDSLDPGAMIEVRIPVIDVDFSIQGEVVWCEQRGQEFEIGVSFANDDEVFRLRMVEQICHVEHYKNEVFRAEGRDLSSEEAAKEWIKRFASDFPQVRPS
ncbi:MAG: PilZ domain-containing protein [Gammaproteobacteria bacterium]|nr:PilZ domain-containing protein [Gammaproteobacteria bacterium]